MSIREYVSDVGTNWNWHGIKLVSALVYLSMILPLVVVVVNNSSARNGSRPSRRRG